MAARRGEWWRMPATTAAHFLAYVPFVIRGSGIIFQSITQYAVVCLSNGTHSFGKKDQSKPEAIVAFTPGI